MVETLSVDWFASPFVSAFIYVIVTLFVVWPCVSLPMIAHLWLSGKGSSMRTKSKPIPFTAPKNNRDGAQGVQARALVDSLVHLLEEGSHSERLKTSSLITSLGCHDALEGFLRRDNLDKVRAKEPEASTVVIDDWESVKAIALDSTVDMDVRRTALDVLMTRCRASVPEVSSKGTFAR